MGENSGEEWTRSVAVLGFRVKQGIVRLWVGLHWKEGVMWRGKAKRGLWGFTAKGLWLQGCVVSTRVVVEEYSGTSSVVVYSMHILDFNQRRDE